MSSDAQRLLDEGRQLSPAERERLAECLPIDDESVSAAEVESAWDTEIKRRLDEVDSGAVQLIPAEQVIAEMEAKLVSPPRRRRSASSICEVNLQSPMGKSNRRSFDFGRGGDLRSG